MHFPTIIKARLLAGLVIFSLGIAYGEPRTWTDTSGKFKVDAEFVSLDGSVVTLRLAGGKTLKIPLKKLSEVDKEAAMELAQGSGAGFNKEKQEESIAAIKKLGGSVRQRGDENPGLVVTIQNKAALVHLEGLTNVTRLEILGDVITDTGLAHLKGLTGLKELNLFATKDVGNSGLKHLKGLTRLESLSIFGTKVTDAGFVHLSELSNLRKLSHSGSNLTGSGFKALSGLTKLEVVELKLSLDFKDVGLGHLKNHANLTRLGLQWTKVSNAGLEHLKGMTKLKHLDLHLTKVTKVGKDKLQAELPDCKIVWYGPM